MEINRFEEVLGVVAISDIPEGRMALLTSNSWSYDFGSRTDLPGAKLPASAEEAKVATFCITWQVTQVDPPYYFPTPAYNWGLRQTFDQASNVPFNADVRLTWPGHQNCVTIPSGTPCLAFGMGTYTVPSGCGYINDSHLTSAGTLLQVANTAEDGGAANAGKLKYLATVSDRLIAVVEKYNTSTGDLTFRLVR